MESIRCMCTGIFHVLFNAMAAILGGCKRVCETRDAKKKFYLLLLVFGLIAVASQPLHADYLDTWNWRSPLPQGNTLLSVAYGNSTFVAVGSDHNSAYIVTSPDGVTWTTRASEGIKTDSDYAGYTLSKTLYGVTYGNSKFVAVGVGGDIVTSTKGVSWKNRKTSVMNNDEDIEGVAYGNSIFVTVGSEGTILTSPNGKTWQTRSSGTTESLEGVIYSNSIFVAVGSGGTILTSPDGVTWTTRASGTTKGYSTVSLSGITYGNSTFVAVGTSYESEDGSDYDSQSYLILTSPDGVTWTTRALGTNEDNSSLDTVTYGNSTFVAVGVIETILQSDSSETPLGY